MKKSRLLCTLCGCTLSLSAAPINATLVELDLVNGSGDGLLTLDTNSRLEWLDLTATESWSYTDFLAGMGGYVAQGFRITTSNEVRGLYTAAGIVDYCCQGFISENVPGVTFLQGLMGVTYIDNKGIYRSIGKYIADYISPADPNRNLVESPFMYDPATDTARAFVDSVGTGTDVNQDYHGGVGIFVARDSSVVPLPAALWLFGSGLIGLMGVARKKRLN